MKMGCQSKEHNRWAALRIYTNQTSHLLCSLPWSPNFTCTYCGGLMPVLHSVKALLGTFNQEKALVGFFSVKFS